MYASKAKIINIVIILLIVVSISLLFIYRDPIAIKLFGAPVTPTSENLTELYFYNYQNLPKIERMNQYINFSFLIHNLENRKMNYSYEVSLSDNTGRHVMDDKTISLENNQSRIISESFRSTTSSHAAVMVLIPKQNQSISFWIN